MFTKTCWLLLLFVAIATTLGCGGRVTPPLREELARQTLVDTLDQWKSGKEIADCQSASPSVVVQDFDWMQGQPLKSYEILGERSRDANLFVTVRLTLADSDTAQKTVEYCVGTDPVLTVFRTLEAGGAGL